MRGNLCLIAYKSKGWTLYLEIRELWCSCLLLYSEKEKRKRKEKEKRKREKHKTTQNLYKFRDFNFYVIRALPCDMLIEQLQVPILLLSC